MSEEYVLTRDIIYDHSERMLNIRKYYPFFKVADTSFKQYRDGEFECLDMGYILMAVLRFFIEKNNFDEEYVTYEQYYDFMVEILHRDFGVRPDEEIEKELVLYIFDKIRNDGKPFVYEYFNPVDKKKQNVRVRLIDSRIENDTVYYSITSDAVEFYLDTKEVKDESNITMEQLLLGKLISSKNFRGGTQVVRRINNEVGRIIARKNEVLNILSHDVFKGVREYQDFNDNVVKWFDEEQKLFAKNKELIDQALRQGERENSFYSAMEEIYQLESELNRAITRHGKLLSECTDLQMKADELISKAKYGRLRTSFDFTDYMSRVMETDRAELLENIIMPILGLNIRKRFDLVSIDDMLTYGPEKEEAGEKITDEEIKDYVYEDEKEDERIKWNYRIFTDVLFKLVKSKREIELTEFENAVSDTTGKDVLKNGDWYSYLVHLCQKKHYSVNDIISRTDTFLEEIIKEYLEENEERYMAYKNLVFNIQTTGQEIVSEGISERMNLIICAEKNSH